MNEYSKKIVKVPTVNLFREQRWLPPARMRWISGGIFVFFGVLGLAHALLGR